jgi:hypothetical protein
MLPPQSAGETLLPWAPVRLPLTSGTPTVTISGTGTIGGGSGLVKFYNLTTSTSGTITLGTDLTVNNVLTIGSSTTLDASSKTITLAGSGTPFVATGTFTSSTSVVKYTSTSSTNIAGTANGGAISYYDLQSAPAGTPTHTLGTAASQTINVTHDFTVGTGSNASIVTAATNNPTINIGRNLTVSASATYTKGSGTTTFNGTASAGTITCTGTCSDSGNSRDREDQRRRRNRYGHCREQSSV